MLRRVPNRTYRNALLALLASAGFAFALPAGSASAEGLFDFLFGGRRPPPPAAQAYAPPEPSNLWRPMFQDRGPAESVRSSSGPSGPHAAFCVRLCDGRYFPVQGHRNASAAEMCNAFCPASPTKLFSGGGIDHAVARDGTHYADLDNAFVYRKRFVPNCTCDGKTAVGVVRVTVDDDPTLRPGDIVATDTGLVAFNGKTRRQEASFTPIDQVRMSKSMREHLAEVKIRRQLPQVNAATRAATEEAGDASPPNERERREVNATER